MPRFLLYNKLIYQKETLCFSTNCSGYSLGTLAAVQRVMAVHPQAGRWSLFADCQRTVPGTAKKLMPQSTYKWVHYLLIAPFIRQYLTLASHSEIKLLLYSSTLASVCQAEFYYVNYTKAPSPDRGYKCDWRKKY